MAASSTVIVGLVYRDGVLICADSQTSDFQATVRWPSVKLHQVNSHPIVCGMSGSTGASNRLYERMCALDIRSTTLAKRKNIREALDRALVPEYKAVAERSHVPPGVPNVPPIALAGLIAMWAEGGPCLLEYELNGDSDWHEHFHAVGSGAQTAYAVYRALGGRRLIELSEARARAAILRIVRTCIGVEMFGVAEPIYLWRVNSKGAREIGRDELNADLQTVDEWEAEEQERLFAADAEGRT